MDYSCSFRNEILLEIFEQLPPDEFNHICLVCKRWYEVMNDGGLWKSKLFLNYRVLMLDSLDEMAMLTRLPPEQLIYDPEERILARQIYKLLQYPSFSSTPHLFLHNLNATMRPFHLVMFGLGMESAPTNKITNNILRGRNSTFMVAGLAQGGVRVRYKSRHVLHIFTLYTNIKSVRESATRGAAENLFSKWLVPEVQQEGGECDPTTSYRLQYPLRKLIMATDGFVCVCDSTKSQCVEDDKIWMEKSRECLHIIMEEAALSENMAARRPLLLLSGIDKKEASNCLITETVDGLGLREFNRPWSICNVDVEYLQGVENGFNWLLYSIMARNEVKSINRMSSSGR